MPEIPPDISKAHAGDVALTPGQAAFLVETAAGTGAADRIAGISVWLMLSPTLRGKVPLLR